MPQPFCAMILLLPMGSSSAPFKNMDVSLAFIVTLLIRVNPLHRANFMCSVRGMKIQLGKHNTSYMLQLDTKNMCCHIVITSLEVGEKVVGVKRS